MKRYSFIQGTKIAVTGLLCCFYSTATLAQFNTVKVDALSAVSGRVGVAYERTMNKYLTLQMGAEYGSFANAVLAGKKDYNLLAFSIVPEIRYYPFSQKRNAPYGFFIGETLRCTSYKEIYKDLLRGGAFPVDAYSTSVSFGLDAGYKFRYKRFSFETTIGYGLISELQLDDKRRFILFYIDDLLIHQNGFRDENGFLMLKALFGYTFFKRGE